MRGSFFSREEIVPETNSSGGYIRGKVDLKHNFSLREDSKNFPDIVRVLRIDIWEKRAFSNFSLINTTTGENVTCKIYWHTY